MKQIISSKPLVFWVVLAFLWVKTIVVSLTEFQFSLENVNQLIILLLNPLPVLLLAFTFILMQKEKRQTGLLLIFMSLISAILYANIVYYREFTDFITIPLLLMGNNVNDLGSSIQTLVNGYDLLFFIDIPIAAILLYKWKKARNTPDEKYSFKKLSPLYGLIILITIANISLANIERPELLTRTFDRDLLVKNLGIYSYHIYDAQLHITSSVPRVFANESELEEVNDYINEEAIDYIIKEDKEDMEKSEEKDLFGIAEGKNVIFVAAESLQDFVINETVNGEEITPFLNDLIDDSLYFEEFYHQSAQGKSSDSEFLVANSLYPSARGAVFFTHSSNDYYAMPEIMKENGYYTASLHGNNGSFWNRNVMYEQFGYDRFYTKDDYNVTEENSIGWGLKDIPFMEQSVDHMLDMPQPFYTNLITLTNHFPFDLGEEDMYIDRYDSNSNTLNKYFPTVRYMDESIKELFNELKENGLYEDSMIIIYGDHNGISTNHNKAMSQYLDKEVTPFVEVELQQVPLIIHIPGAEGETISTVSGQIDVRPTLFHLLGMEIENQTIFGNNLFSEDREELVILRNGDFITDEAMFIGNTCYDKTTGEPAETPLCESYKEKVQEELQLSDSIIQGDLLRFSESIKEQQPIQSINKNTFNEQEH
ncbi:LTA synthase family protein [Salipaludibacillus sp. CF4.18]|uniref:LTA synthase family protein n=1 Tax=Salipaludibacillus sp. CF4.18 TaxID=3373081 RepID=UPI003EE52F63